MVACTAWTGHAACAASSAAQGAAHSTGEAATATTATPIQLAVWTAVLLAALLVLRVRWFRTVPRTGPSWPLRSEPTILGFALAFVAMMIGAWLAVSLVPGAQGSDFARATAQGLGAQLGTLAALGFVWLAPRARVRGGPSAVAAGGVHRHPCGRMEALLLTVAFAALLYAIAGGLGTIIGAVQAWLGAPPPAIGHETLRALATGEVEPFWKWTAIATAVVVAPVAEECLYRGFLQQGLKSAGLGLGWSVVATATLFAGIHWGALPEGSRATGLATLWALGVGWGMLFERTGRIGAPVLAHAAFNAINLAMLAK